MSNREDLYVRLPFPIDDCVRKAGQDQPPGSVVTRRPTLWRLHHKFDGAIDFGHKFQGGGLAMLQILLHRRFQLRKSRGMNFEQFAGHVYRRSSRAEICRRASAQAMGFTLPESNS